MVKLNIEKKIELGQREGFKKTRVCTAHLMPVKIRERILTNLLQKLRIVNRADKLDPRITSIINLRLQLFQKAFINSSYEHEIPVSIR